jgi:hypothetical protein
MHDIIAYGVLVLLGFVVVPVWLLAGFADYLCHRASDIEHTSGVPESLMHLAQFTLVGVPLLMVLALDVDAGVLLVLLLFAVAHHGVAYADLRYATGKRVIAPIEQMVHSFLELLPLTAWLLLAALHFDRLVALGQGTADLSIRFNPQPAAYIVSVLLGAGVLGFVPYLEELWRCSHASRDG